MRLSRPLGIQDDYRLALEAAPTGILMLDSKGTIVLVNALIEELFGYSRAELLGEPIDLLIPERHQTQHPGLRGALLGDCKTRPVGGARELRGVRRDGTELPIEIGLNPLRTAAGNFVISSIVDVTD